MPDEQPQPRTAAAMPLATYALVAVLSGLLGFGAIYAIAPRTSPAPVTPASGVAAQVPTAGAPAAWGKALATGQMEKFVVSEPSPLADITFEDASGRKRTFADFRGKVVLLNLWATWCAPCRIEMPSLDRLQATMGSDRFEVVALSIDRGGASVAKKFLDDIGAKNLSLYIESSARSMAALAVTGLPTTILIDREGRPLGRLAGHAEWDSPEAKRLIAAALAR